MASFYSMSYGRFGPRPFSTLVPLQIFAFWPRKVLETFPIQQNVRNGHIYIGVMKQHIPENAHIKSYGQTTVFKLRKNVKSPKLRRKYFISGRSGARWPDCLSYLKSKGRPEIDIAELFTKHEFTTVELTWSLFDNE